MCGSGGDYGVDNHDNVAEEDGGDGGSVGAKIARWWCVGLAVLLDAASWFDPLLGRIIPVEEIFP